MDINPALIRWRKAEIPYALLRNSILWLATIVSPKKRKELALLKNSDLKNTLTGKRCFILGNGPSLTRQDLSLLENEFVFTCNSIAQMPGFEKIHTNIHFWMDPNFFKDDSYLPYMRAVNTEGNHPIVFFPTERKDFVEFYKLDQCLDVRYFSSGYTIYEGYNKAFNFCKMLPLVTTVVSSAIFLAIYMGAKEIYLLGCDCTGAISHIKSLEKNRVENLEYAYRMTEKEKQLRQRAYEADGNEFFFYLQSKGFQHYRILDKYCRKRGIKLINCSAGGILNEIPYEKFEDVIARI